jgi:hypothetical protein
MELGQEEGPPFHFQRSPFSLLLSSLFSHQLFGFSVACSITSQDPPNSFYFIYYNSHFLGSSGGDFLLLKPP